MISNTALIAIVCCCCVLFVATLVGVVSLILALIEGKRIPAAIRSAGKAFGATLGLAAAVTAAAAAVAAL